MSRRAAVMSVINLEEGKPAVETARLRMQHELERAQKAGAKAVKLIHGYGSSGAGGTLRTELQKELRQAAQSGIISTVIAGEDWRISDENTWALLQRFPEWKKDRDLARNNQGISIVVF